jgi:hypothetical protein
VSEIPEGSNFFASLETTKSLEAIAGLYSSAGWEVRMCSWTDFEVTSAIGELIIEGKPPLVHGPVADPLVNLDAVTKPLRDAAIAFSCECYDEEGNLLAERKWSLNP